MEPKGQHIKKWWAAIPNSILLQFLSDLEQARGAEKKWTKAMAYISLKLDLDARNAVSILAYRERWGWSHHRVVNFLQNSGLELVKIDEKNSRSLSILKSTHNQHQIDIKSTDNRHIKVIDLEDSERQTDTKPTPNRRQTDTQGDTSKNKPDPDLDLEQLAGLLQNLDANSQEYVKYELRRKDPTNPVAYAQAVIRRLAKENGGSNEDYGRNGNECSDNYSRLAELEEQARREAEAEAAGAAS